jgi:NAD(P)-dependent dehydrogenase (short-subunit alcohol dehydrogenase family)
VTGGSRGIGLAVATALAHEDVKVAIIGRDSASLAAAKAALPFAERHLALTADLARAEEGSAAVAAALAAWGRIDLLVNNAASSRFGDFDTVTDDDWVDAFQLKLLGYVRMARAVLPGMRAHRAGCIINVVGVGGRVASEGYALGAINAAALHWTRTVGDLVAKDGVRVLAVNPGATRTERLAAGLAARAAAHGVDAASEERSYVANIPLGRLGKPDEVGRLVCVMASHVFGNATGSSVFLDGGGAHGDF